MLAHVRPIGLFVNILPFNIFDRCNLPLYEFGVKSGTLIANTALFITFDRVTFQPLHASLYWYGISNFNRKIRCSSLSWTVVLATIVEWSYFHVGWSIPVVSQESYESFVTWYSNVICVHRKFWAFFLPRVSVLCSPMFVGVKFIHALAGIYLRWTYQILALATRN